jgi:hypothetical protein
LAAARRRLPRTHRLQGNRVPATGLARLRRKLRPALPPEQRPCDPEAIEVIADNRKGEALAVLTEDRDARRIHEATEPRPLTFSEAVAELAIATGGSIRYMRISTERCAALLAGRAVPEEVVVRLMRVVTELLDARHARQAPGVEHAIGRESHDFGDHARASSRSLSG